MASLKCSAIALYQCHREWDSEATYAEEEKKEAERLQKEQAKRDARYAKWLKTRLPPTGQGDDQKGVQAVDDASEFERQEAKRKKRLELKEKMLARHSLANEVRKILVALFKEIKRYLNDEGGLKSLFRVYVLFDELFVV